MADHSTRRIFEQLEEATQKEQREGTLLVVSFIFRAVFSFPGQGDKVHDAMNHTKDQEDKNNIAYAYILHTISLSPSLLNLRQHMKGRLGLDGFHHDTCLLVIRGNFKSLAQGVERPGTIIHLEPAHA